jgi:hypothetical protein
MLNKEDIVETLVNSGADIDYGSPPPVTIAASMGREKSLNLFLERSVNLNAEVFFAFVMFHFYPFSIFWLHDVRLSSPMYLLLK